MPEIGCGTGKETEPLAGRGLRITGLELGPQPAAAAHRILAPIPDATVVNASYDTWQRPTGIRFDLVFAATTWHRLIRCRTARKSRRDNGHLAFWSATHVFPDEGDQFFRYAVTGEQCSTSLAAARRSDSPTPTRHVWHLRRAEATRSSQMSSSDLPTVARCASAAWASLALSSG